MSYARSASWHPEPGCSYPEGVYPATVRQLLRAKQQHSQSSFFLDGIKLGKVTCVAGIVAVLDRPSMKFKLYVLEDGSAGRLSMVLSRSLRSEIDPLLEGALKTNVYVRVIGQLKGFNGINELTATHIRLVVDMHEPFFHCLEAMVVFLSNQRKSPIPRAQLSNTAPEVAQSPQSMQRAARHTEGGTEDKSTAQESGADLNTTLAGIDELTLFDDSSDDEFYEPEFVEQISPPPSPSSRSRPSVSQDPSLGMDDQPSLLLDPYSSLSPLKRHIIIRIQDNTLYFPNGVPIQMMYGRIGPSTVRDSESEIRQAIEDLMDDGLLYSTVDENHFKMVD